MSALKTWIGPLALAAVLLAGAATPGSRAFQWIVFAAMVWALWIAGSRLARWLAPGFGPESHGVAAFSLATALAVVPATWLGHFGALRPGPFLVWTAAAVLLARLVPAAPPPLDDADDADDAEPAADDRRERIYLALLLAAGLAVAFLGVYDLGRLRNSPAGPYGFDDVSYHLSAVATWIRHGDLRMIRFSMGDPSTSFYPVQGELASWVLIAPFRDSDVAGRWSQFPFAVFSFLAVAAIARRLGLRRRDAAFAAVSYAGIFHIFPLLAISAGNDHSTSFFTLAGLDAGLALAGRNRNRLGVAMVAGAAVGQLLGTKYIGVLFAPPLLAAVAVAWIAGRKNEERRRIVPVLLVLVAAAALTGGYTYLRNSVTTGNPIFPAPVRLFGAEVFPGWEGVSIRDRSTTPEAAIDVWRFLTRKSRLFGTYFPFTLLPAALLAPLLALWRRRWAAAAAFLLATVFFLEFLFLMHDHRDIRYFLPAIALAAVAFSWLLARAGAWTFYVRAALLVWIAFQVPRYRLFGWPPAGEIAAFLAFLAIGALAARFTVPRAWAGRWGWAAVAAAVLVLALPAGTLIERYQQKKFSPLPSAGALEELAGPQGARIAYAGMNQPYFYFGSRFQNDLEIVPRNRSLADRFHTWGRPLAEPGPYLGGAYKRWRGNLLRMGIDMVVIVRGEWQDPERRWIDKRSEDFQLLYQDDRVEIWKVIPDVRRPGRRYNPPDAARRHRNHPRNRR